jgi:hypothetical protein
MVRGGDIQNVYQTKYKGIYHDENTLRRSVYEMSTKCRPELYVETTDSILWYLMAEIPVLTVDSAGRLKSE